MVKIDDIQLNASFSTKLPNKDEPEFDKLISDCYAYVYKLLRNKGCTVDDATGLSHGVIIKLYANINNFAFNSQLTTWLYVVTINHYRNWLNRTQMILDSIIDDVAFPPSIDNDPEQVFIKKETTDLVHKALNKMPSKYRNILHLFYFQNYSYQEIAQILKLNIRTVETRLYRARKMMISIIKQSDVA